MPNKSTKQIIFCGGGSGGHVFPLLAVFEKLAPEVQQQICWWGSKKGIERRLLAATAIPYRAIPCGKLRRYFSWRTLPDLLNAAIGLCWCYLLLLFRRPVLVVSKGGYVALPVAVAARLLKIRVLTHESDIRPGLATKIIAVYANKVLLANQATMKYFSKSNHDKYLVTGNPVREEFYHGDRQLAYSKWQLSERKPLLVVLGGSLGALQINRLIEECWQDICADFQVIHQHGDHWQDAGWNTGYQQLYNEGRQGRGHYRPVTFISEGLADILAASSVVVSRAGAGTLAELVAAGCSALLVPLGSNSRGEQWDNAAAFCHDGYGFLYDKERRLVEQLRPLLQQPPGGRKPPASKPADTIAGLITSYWTGDIS